LRSYNLEDQKLLIPAKARDISLLKNVQTGCGSHVTSYSMGTGILQPRRGVDYSVPSHTEVKNEWRYAPVITLHCLDRDKHTFTP
jgi:hypothetical protein